MLDDQVAIVTGAASGIGRAVALRLAAAGARVVVADLDSVGGQEVADAIDPTGERAFAVRVDVSSPADCDAAAAVTLERFGAIDILHANAGIPFHGNIEDTDEATFDRVIGVNLKGAFFSARAVVPAMKAQRSGAIVFTSSLQGVIARAGFTPYTAAKHGVIGLMKGLALELAPFGVRVNAIAPAATETPMLSQFVDGEVATERFAATIPLGRVARPEEIAGGVLYLVGPDAGLISGHTLVIDGASTAE